MMLIVYMVSNGVNAEGNNENILIILTTYDMEFIFGEEAFLTKEQAEQKLKEMLGDSNV